MARTPTASQVKGLTFERRWTTPGIHPYDEITWEYRTAGIAQRDRQERLRAEGRRGPRTSGASSPPTSWSASTSAATSTRRSARPASASSSTASSTRSRPGPRPSTTSRRDEDLRTFKAELTHLLVHQKMASTRRSGSTSASRRSRSARPASSTRVQDTMSSIMDLAKTEAMLFKFGSGAGSNLSHHPLAPRRR